MNYSIFVIMAMSAALMFSACKGNNEVKKLQLATENIHDDAMKEMAVMNRISRDLKKQLTAMDSAQVSSPRKDSMVLVLANIRKAEEDMMQWMTQYKDPKGMSNDAAISYLKDQKLKIEQNQRDILAAIDLGKRMQK
jgi:hypothetical protein